MHRFGCWDRLSTDWAVLDAEIMPWPAKGAGADPRMRGLGAGAGEQAGESMV